MIKRKVLLLFGGESPEHEVSIMSAKSLIKAIDRKKYELFLVYINRRGGWCLINEGDMGVDSIDNEKQKCGLVPGSGGLMWVGTSDKSSIQKIDVVFPLLHGENGEDGSLQGYLDLVGVPYVGCGMAASMVCMDKELMKIIFKEKKIINADYLVWDRKSKIDYEAMEKEIGWPLFVKPARAGSSIGVSRVNNQKEFSEALKRARKIDSKVIIEKQIIGREIEIGVLGNDNPKASLPGEVVIANGWYDYDTKYANDQAKLLVPAEVSIEKVVEIKELALAVFQMMGCRGLARVDMFLTETGELFVNEINTMPGFTEKSMYVKLWEESEIGYSELIDRLIELAMKVK